MFYHECGKGAGLHHHSSIVVLTCGQACRCVVILLIKSDLVPTPDDVACDWFVVIL